MIFPFLFLEASHSSGTGFSEILVGPRVRPLDTSSTRKISQLACPIEHFSGFIRRECPDHADQ
jgi:hypothetical protein